MNLRRGNSRRVLAAIAATAMCGAGLAMGAGAAQANPQIQRFDDGGLRPYTAPFDPFPAVFLLPPGTVAETSSNETADISNWAWTQLDHEQSAGLLNSGAAQAVAGANINFASGIAQRLVDDRSAIDAGGCFSMAYSTNPGDYAAALAGDTTRANRWTWTMGGDNAAYCGQ